jgi:hypothetical protein
MLDPMAVKGDTYITLFQGEYLKRKLEPTLTQVDGTKIALPMTGGVGTTKARSNPHISSDPIVISVPLAIIADGHAEEEWVTATTQNIVPGVYSYETVVTVSSKNYVIDAGRVEIKPTSNR